MSLTPAELAAARAFRAARRAGLAKLAADITVSVFVRNDRHDCAKRGGKSVFLELREHYAYSPSYVVSKDLPEDARQDVEDGQQVIGGRIVGEFDGGDPEACQDLIDAQQDAGLRHLSIIEAVVPEKRFGWIWTQGKCSACGLTARSSAGRLVDPEERPPAEHAIVS